LKFGFEKLLFWLHMPFALCVVIIPLKMPVVSRVVWSEN
jgi:hypothetical protein